MMDITQKTLKIESSRTGIQSFRLYLKLLTDLLKDLSYSQYIKNSTLRETIKEAGLTIKAIKTLTSVLEEEGRTMTGSQIAWKIRQEKDPNWPQPDFIKPGACIRLAKKLGLVDIEERGDFFVTLK